MPLKSESRQSARASFDMRMLREFWTKMLPPHSPLRETPIGLQYTLSFFAAPQLEMHKLELVSVLRFAGQDSVCPTHRICIAENIAER